MKVIYNGPGHEHAFSLQCEDAAIGIENPEVLGEAVTNIWMHDVTIKPNDTFPLPENIEWEKQSQKRADGEWIKCAPWQYENREDDFRRQVIRLKLKSKPEDKFGIEKPDFGKSLKVKDLREIDVIFMSQMDIVKAVKLAYITGQKDLIARIKDENIFFETIQNTHEETKEKIRQQLTDALQKELSEFKKLNDTLLSTCDVWESKFGETGKELSELRKENEELKHWKDAACKTFIDPIVVKRFESFLKSK